jgi:hypothetical protein
VPYWNKYSASIEGVERFAIFETNYTDVFMLPFSMPRAEFPLITNRAIFFGNGFPFNANFFKEYDERQTAIEGNGFETHFYRKLGPNDFISISKKFDIDHVVIESEFSSQFNKCEFEYSNKEYKIYALRALKKCAEDTSYLKNKL